MISYLDGEILVSCSFCLILQSYYLQFASKDIFENPNLHRKLNYHVCCVNLPLRTEIGKLNCVLLN